MLQHAPDDVQAEASAAVPANINTAGMQQTIVGCLSIIKHEHEQVPVAAPNAQLHKVGFCLDVWDAGTGWCAPGNGDGKGEGDGRARHHGRDVVALLVHCTMRRGQGTTPCLRGADGDRYAR